VAHGSFLKQPEGSCICQPIIDQYSQELALLEPPEQKDINHVFDSLNTKYLKLFECNLPENALFLNKIEVNMTIKGQAQVFLNIKNSYDQFSKCIYSKKYLKKDKNGQFTRDGTVKIKYVQDGFKYR